MKLADVGSPPGNARSLRSRTIVLASACLLFGATLAWTGPAWGGPEPACGWHMTSLSKDGKASRATYDYPTGGAAVSTNGRYVTFSSDAHNLTGNDDDRHSDVFLRDLDEGTIRLVSRGKNGRDLNGHAWSGEINPDGRYLLFSTGAPNAHPDANGYEQIYRLNIKTGRIDLVSRATTGAPANISTGGGSMTPDGRYVVFTTPATNMTGGSGSRNDSNFHAYMRDIKRGRTIPLDSISGGRGVFGVRSISADGRFVPFVSGPESGPLEVYILDVEQRRSIRGPRNHDGSSPGSRQHARNPVITPNGRYVMFTSASSKLVPGDTNDAEDVFVYDRRTKRTVRVSVGTGGNQANRPSLGLSISNDGTVVTFTSRANNLDKRVADFGPWARINAYAHDLDAGRTRLFTICDDGTETTGYHNPDPLLISGNKRIIVAEAQASNMSPESSQGPQFRYQVYHRDFDIRPPTVLTTAGPYVADPGVPVDLSATARKPNGDPRAGITIRFVVAKRNGEVVWQDSATTDSSGSATVTHTPSLDVRRYEVTSIVPATPTHARAETTDELAVGL